MAICMSFHLDKERYIELFLLNQISEFMATYAAIPGWWCWWRDRGSHCGIYYPQPFEFLKYRIRNLNQL